MQPNALMLAATPASASYAASPNALPAGELALQWGPAVPQARLPDVDRRRYQTVLERLGHYPTSSGNADGVLGQRTVAAVKSFQRTEGLADDGSLGPATQQRLQQRWAALPPGTSIPPRASAVQAAAETPGASAPPAPGAVPVQPSAPGAPPAGPEAQALLAQAAQQQQRAQELAQQAEQARQQAAQQQSANAQLAEQLRAQAAQLQQLAQQQSAQAEATRQMVAAPPPAPPQASNAPMIAAAVVGGVAVLALAAAVLSSGKRGR